MMKQIYEEMSELERLAVHMIADDTLAAYGDAKMVREYLQRHDDLHSDFTADSPITFDHRAEILAWLVVYMQDHNIGSKSASPVTTLPSWTPQSYEIIDGRVCVTGRRDRESDYRFD